MLQNTKAANLLSVSIRKAKSLNRRQPWRLRGGTHDWGFKVVTRGGKRVRVSDPEERGLMQFCLCRKDEGATIRTICNEVEARFAALENRRPLAYAFQKFTPNMCKAAIAKERRLQAEAAEDRRILEHAHDLPTVPAGFTA